MLWGFIKSEDCGLAIVTLKVNNNKISGDTHGLEWLALKGRTLGERTDVFKLRCADKLLLVM